MGSFLGAPAERSDLFLLVLLSRGETLFCFRFWISSSPFFTLVPFFHLSTRTVGLIDLSSYTSGKIVANLSTFGSKVRQVVSGGHYRRVDSGTLPSSPWLGSSRLSVSCLPPSATAARRIYLGLASKCLPFPRPREMSGGLQIPPPSGISC